MSAEIGKNSFINLRKTRLNLKEDLRFLIEGTYLRLGDANLLDLRQDVFYINIK